jgi:hypothetical protein
MLSGWKPDLQSAPGGDAEILHADGVEIEAKHPVPRLMAKLAGARRGRRPNKSVRYPRKYLPLFWFLSHEPIRQEGNRFAKNHP